MRGERAPAGADHRTIAAPLQHNALLALTVITAWHVTLPVVPLYAAALGAGPLLVGLTASAAVALPLVVGVHVGAAVDAVGGARVARVSAVAFAGAFGVLAVWHTLPALIVALAVAGLADIGLVVASQAQVAALSTPASRDRNFGHLAVSMAAGALVGPVIGGALADAWGFAAAFGASALLGLGAIGLSARLPDAQPSRDAVAPVGARGALAEARRLLALRAVLLLLLANAAVMFASGLRASFYPLYLQRVGLSITTIGVVFSAYSVCSLAVRALIDPGVRWLGYRGLLATAVTLTAVGVAATPFLTTFPTLVVALGVTGVATGFMQPLVISLVAAQASPATRGLALGLRISVMQLAQLLGPPLFGVAVAVADLGAAFAVAAAVAALGLVPVALLSREHLSAASAIRAAGTDRRDARPDPQAVAPPPS